MASSHPPTDRERFSYSSCSYLTQIEVFIPKESNMEQMNDSQCCILNQFASCLNATQLALQLDLNAQSKGQRAVNA
jgi:hypothetical protein